MYEGTDRWKLKTSSAFSVKSISGDILVKSMYDDLTNSHTRFLRKYACKINKDFYVVLTHKSYAHKR
jgi:hypothetical protein